MLSLHKGITNLDKIRNLPNPTSKGPRHRPLHHHDLVEMVNEEIDKAGIDVAKSNWSVTGKDNAQMTGEIQFAGFNSPDDFGGLTFGLNIRHANDQSRAFWIQAGASVQVCSNGLVLPMGQEEQQNAIRHTQSAPSKIREELQRFLGGMDAPVKKIAAFRNELRNIPCNHDDAINYFGRMVVDHKALTGSDFSKAWKEWSDPRHEDFEPRTFWSAYNAVNEVLKRHAGPQQVKCLTNLTSGTLWDIPAARQAMKSA